MAVKQEKVLTYTGRVRVSVNLEGTSTVTVEVGYKPNEYAQFGGQIEVEGGYITGPVKLAEFGAHKIAFESWTRFFTFWVPINAHPGTPFTMKLSTSGPCNGWFEFGGLHCGADHGGWVEQSYNATLDGVKAQGEAVRS